jgi:hypothetical protein
MSKFGITMNPTITREGMIELFWDALCGGSIGFGSVSLDCDKKTYDDARERTAILKAASPSEYITGSSVCYEDVMTEVLRAGDELYYMEYGYDDENSRVAFDLDHLMDNFENVEPYILEQMLNDYDSVTTDSLLQCLLLGEIVYG